MKVLFQVLEEEDLHVQTGTTQEGKWKEERRKICFDHIFPHLGWNDLLRFRRVCKDAKDLADEYIKERGEHLCPEITIYEASNNKERTLTKFLRLGFPATRIYLMNISGFQMFEKNGKQFIEFLEKHGGRVTHVRVHKLQNNPFGIERKFYEGLSNLESLVVDMFGGFAATEEEAIMGAELEKAMGSSLPMRFKTLKKFTVGLVSVGINMNVFIASRAVTDFCENLEYCGDAFSSGIKLGNMEIVLGSLQLAFETIQKYIEGRSKSAPDKPNLKFYDFATFNDDHAVMNKCHAFVNAPYFSQLARVCVKNSVKLLNVNAGWLQNWTSNVCRLGLHELNAIGNLIVSMVNMHGWVADLDMENLEKVVIPATSRSCLFPYGSWKKVRKPWSSLKTLDVTVDSKLLYTLVTDFLIKTDQSVCLDPETTAGLMQFFFVGIRREALAEVTLKFEDGLEIDNDTVKAASYVGSCCPNLKMLTLGNWPGSNASLVKMWGEMKNLEELVLDKCKNTGNLAFVRTDTTDAVYTKLQKLKKLSLLGLDKMPKLTDILFKDVISQMKLTHLILSSEKPISNITPKGVRSLRTGVFAESIEKFPFNGWSLAKQRKEDFARMETEFRSYQMV